MYIHPEDYAAIVLALQRAHLKLLEISANPDYANCSPSLLELRSLNRVMYLYTQQAISDMVNPEEKTGFGEMIAAAMGDHEQASIQP